jgi:uncharacterized protein RhaS with RHS repeats
VYYRARYYDVQIGRFVIEDPTRHRSGQLNYYSYVADNPVNYRDPRGLKVYRCSREARFMAGNFNMNIIGLTHQWIKTDSKEVGLGPARGGVPGGGGSDVPFSPTALTNHAGASSQPGVECQEITEVDEDCVNRELKVGQPQGRFFLTPWNQCQAVTTRILKKCSTKAHIPDPFMY